MLMHLSLLLMFGAAAALMNEPVKAAPRPINYSKVTNAELERAGDLLVRYVLTADNPCLTIQYLKPGHPGIFLRDRTICSLGEARFDRDFALVDFKALDLHDDRLDVEVEFTPSRRGRKVIRWCSIALQPDSIGDLVCNR
ncbi:hypothetical protein FJN21_20680 [Stenotrophomonas maltophilia]|uniref:hypothetical protein n=2 Tax=Lysobacteraceae TaxID=32033 RepID=UPI0011235EF8|nr:hypothetical protein [Stenotrophomonas sp. PvP093]TPD74102.1 hypothetical protein FJN21_20680 [Stenotrophomonas maltophilia]TPD76102.1 hypothetical protein FJN20_19355 [Stenotrophomonas maltophilia]TPD78638.1 hypothetical protein FJN19_18785 [Stenotrophomonas maltophilia]